MVQFQVVIGIKLLLMSFVAQSMQAFAHVPFFAVLERKLCRVVKIFPIAENMGF
jgi:hypothetical protein